MFANQQVDARPSARIVNALQRYGKLLLLENDPLLWTFLFDFEKNHPHLVGRATPEEITRTVRTFEDNIPVLIYLNDEQAISAVKASSRNYVIFVGPLDGPEGRSWFARFMEGQRWEITEFLALPTFTGYRDGVFVYHGRQ